MERIWSTNKNYIINQMTCKWTAASRKRKRIDAYKGEKEQQSDRMKKKMTKAVAKANNAAMARDKRYTQTIAVRLSVQNGTEKSSSQSNDKEQKH